MPWQVVARSAIGTKHVQKKQPCQDHGNYHKLSEGEIVIGAISDGMGSAKYSDTGSKVAVEVAISQLKNIDWQKKLTEREKAKEIFHNLLITASSELKNEAEQHGYSIQDLACTLLVFVATPDCFTAMQVGDGLLVVRSKDDKDYKLLFQPDKGEFANETTSITSSDVLDEVQIRLELKSYEFICAATDGIENISLMMREGWRPSEKFFRPLERYMLSQESESHKSEEIDKFLNSDKINLKTDDDKTLLLCVFQSPAVTEVANQSTSEATDLTVDNQSPVVTEVVNQSTSEMIDLIADNQPPAVTEVGNQSTSEATDLIVDNQPTAVTELANQSTSEATNLTVDHQPLVVTEVANQSTYEATDLIVEDASRQLKDENP